MAQQEDSHERPESGLDSRASPSAGKTEGGLVAFETEYSSGPLPHPRILQEYDAVCPGAAERILVMAERQSEHRRDLEAKALDAEIADAKAARVEARIGQAFGLVIGLACVAGGAMVAILNPRGGGAAAGSIIGGTGVVGLVSAFIYGRRTARSDSGPPQGRTPDAD